jgi:hypothetical protein
VDSQVLLQHSAPVERGKSNVRTEILVAVNIKIMVFCDLMPGTEGNKVIASTS